MMTGAAARPVAIELDRTRELRIRWADGEASVYPLPQLRQLCPCASCRTERDSAAASMLPVVPPPEVQAAMVIAERIEVVGQYAIRITWKDGHDTGIYDYAMLRSLASQQTRE
jgi:DUF971 family protein